MSTYPHCSYGGSGPRESRVLDCRHFDIIRFYRKGGRRVIRRGMTLSEAQAHCNDPETSSTTATGSNARRITRRNGAWFDGYSSEDYK